MFLVQVVELTASLILIEQQVQMEVLKEKIKKTVQEHQPEFKILSQIHTLFNNFHHHPILTENLRQLDDLLAITWKVVAQNLEEKVELVNDLTSKFKDIHASQYGMSFKSGAFLGMMTAIAAYQVYGLSKSFSKVPNVSGQTAISQLRSGLINQKIVVSKLKVQGSSSKLKTGEVSINQKLIEPRGNIKGAYQIQASGNLKTAFQGPSQSIWGKMKNFGSKTGKVLLGGLRALGILAMFYGIYTGQQQIKTLYDELKKYNVGGQFKLQEINIMNLVLAASELMSNLAYASYAVQQDISNTYLILAATLSQLNEQMMNLASKYAPDKSWKQFCQDSNNLFKELCSVKVTQNSSTEEMRKGLEKMYNQYYNYNKKHQPMEIFTDLAKKLNKFTIQKSIFLQNQSVKETVITDFKITIKNYFLKRLQKHQKLKSNNSLEVFRQKLKSKDRSFVKMVSAEYLNFRSQVDNTKKQFEFEQYEELFKLSQNQLQQIGDLIASFTNQIYSESDDGKTLFKKPMLSFKSTQLYGQVLTKAKKLPNSIPIPFGSQEEKKKMISKLDQHTSLLIKQGKLPNIFDEKLFTILQKISVIKWTTLKDHFQINGKKYDKMKFQKAIIYDIIDLEAKKKNQSDQRIVQVKEGEGELWQGKFISTV